MLKVLPMRTTFSTFRIRDDFVAGGRRQVTLFNDWGGAREVTEYPVLMSSPPPPPSDAAEIIFTRAINTNPQPLKTLECWRSINPEGSKAGAHGGGSGGYRVAGTEAITSSSSK